MIITALVVCFVFMETLTHTKTNRAIKINKKTTYLNMTSTQNNQM